MPNGAIGIIREYADGKLYRFNGYNAYVPNDYNSNTPVMYYLCGDGGNDAYVAPFTTGAHGNFHNRFSAGGAKSIVIQVPRNISTDTIAGTSSGSISGDAAGTYVNDIKKNLGLTGNMTVSVSHSGSAVNATNAVVSLLGNNPAGQAPIVSAVMDGFVPSSLWGSNGYIDKLKQNNSVFLMFAQNQTTSTAKGYYASYLELARQGVNSIIFEDNKSKDGRARYHIEMSDAFTELGVYDYLSGTGKIDFSQFKSIRAFINGQEITLDPSKIDDAGKLYSLFGIDASKYNINGGLLDTSGLANLKDFVFTSNEAVLEKHLNRIRGCIRNSRYLTGNLTAPSGGSTTQVPSAIGSCVSNHFNKVTSTLNKIATLTDSIAEVHQSYVNTDKKITNEVRNI